MAEGSEGFDGRRPVRILASRICRSDSKREWSSEGDAKSDAALSSNGRIIQHILGKDRTVRASYLHVEKDLADLDEMPGKGDECLRILFLGLHQGFQILCVGHKDIFVRAACIPADGLLHTDS